MCDLVMIYAEHAASYFAVSKYRYWEIKRKAFCPLKKPLHIQAYTLVK